MKIKRNVIPVFTWQQFQDAEFPEQIVQAFHQRRRKESRKVKAAARKCLRILADQVKPAH